MAILIPATRASQAKFGPLLDRELMPQEAWPFGPFRASTAGSPLRFLHGCRGDWRYNPASGSEFQGNNPEPAPQEELPSGARERPVDCEGNCHQEMKFGEKYDLQESLTTGGVETFVANDKIRGERVLVHILHCDPQKPNQPTVQWVLESFRRLAPEPAGLVLETGRYSGTLYAYLVTKLPDDAALRTWVQQYESQARDTQQVRAQVPAAPAPAAPAPAPAPPTQAPAPILTANEPPHVPGPVTQLLRSFESQSRLATPSVPPKEPEKPSVPPPAINLGVDQSSLRAASPWSPETPQISVPPRPTPDINRPSGPFRPDFPAQNLPAEPSAPPLNSPKPGEFTSFFQGPFRGDRPSEVPVLSSSSPSLPQEPPRKNVGDFTAMFGSVKQQPEEPPPSKGMAGNEPAGTGFTGWFTPEAPSRTSSTTVPPSTALPRAGGDSGPIFPEPPKEPIVPPSPVSYVAPAPPIFPAPLPPIPPVPKPAAAVPSAQASGGATHAFSPSVSEPAPVPAQPPSGPSAYTEIISVKAMNPAVDPAAASKESAAKSPALPAFAAPPMPVFAMPSPPPIPMPPAPPMPKIAAPAPPKAPKPPKVAAAPPPVSYWPLVLTLTVIFFIAALLVLYFVLKH